MEKKVFDLKTELDKLFLKDNRLEDIKVDINSVEDSLFLLATTNAGKKIDLVFTEKDYFKFGSTVLSPLKNACAEFSTLILEDKEFNHFKNKSFFNFSGEMVIVVGNSELISITAYYASIQKKTCYAVLTEPYSEYTLLTYAKVPTENVHISIEIAPIKALIVDLDILRRASKEAFAESFIVSMSKLISLIDYKFNMLVTDGSYNQESYIKIKNAISLVASLYSYKNSNDVLIYAQLVFASEMRKSNVLKSSSVDLFAEAINLFEEEASYGDKILTAMKCISGVYETFFANDLFDVLNLPNYNGDMLKLEKLTGNAYANFRKNLVIPTPSKLKACNTILQKTKDGFLKEIESFLSVLHAIEKIYKSYFKGTDEKKAISYQTKKEALTLCTYLSKEKTILTHLRDLGVLSCVD